MVEKCARNWSSVLLISSRVSMAIDTKVYVSVALT